MYTDPTDYYHKPIEPTQPAYRNPYEDTNPYYGDVSPIPPPPPTHSGHKWLMLALASTLCLAVVVLGGVLFVVLRANNQQLTPTRIAAVGIPASTAALPTLTPTRPPLTPTLTIDPNYTATDIMSDFNTAGIHPKFVEYNRTIWSWSGDTYYVSVPATSSVDFTDDSGCTGYCSPQDIGVWVYGSSATAIQAYNGVLNDENTVGSAGPMGTPNEVLHGRCLLLGADAQSIYGQVVMQYCV